MKQLVENKRAYKTLAGWLHGGRLPHTVLIEGSQGLGRKTFARNLAAAILCSGEEERPCGECGHCKKVEKDIHPDLITVQGEGGVRSFHIDAVRGVRGEAVKSPNEADAKVFLLLDVEEMTVQAQNALLKLIEEPPAGVHFLLVAENRQRMLPTILSRVAVVTMQTPSAEGCAAVLAERFPDRDNRELMALAVQAGGNVGRALALLDDPQAAERQVAAGAVLDALLAGRELDALEAMRDCERDKQLFAQRLELMRGALAEKLVAGSQNALQLAKIVDIIDEMISASRGNVSMLLLTTSLCAKVSGVLDE